MSEKRTSWGHTLVTPKSSGKVVHAKSVVAGAWSVDRLKPKETLSTKSVRVSYSGMEVIRRNGKK